MTTDDIQKHRQSICEIGRRIYAKDFAAANEGNLSIRIGEDRVLCTPTLHCKGFMEVDDICTVDMTGTQLEGKRKRTSEVLLHLEIYRERPDVTSIVHCHPPHATAFAVAREPIPQCVLPEPDIFLGEVPIAGYETPGNQNFAETIRPFVKKTNIIILANHGTVSFGKEIEEAYWLTEILDAYCRILILARQLGGIKYLPLKKGQELLQLRHEWGFDDTRSPEDCDICSHSAFRDTWVASELTQRAFPPHPATNDGPAVAESASALSPEQFEKLADEISTRILARLGQ